MKISYDGAAHAGYIKLLDDKITKTVVISDTVLCDMNANGNLCGIEILDTNPQTLQTMSQSLQTAEFSFS